jgi:hypothetical protein
MNLLSLKRKFWCTKNNRNTIKIVLNLKHEDYFWGVKEDGTHGSSVTLETTANDKGGNSVHQTKRLIFL